MDGEKDEKTYEENVAFDEKRAAIIIGSNGETKAKIEKETNTTLEINKGVVKIKGKDYSDIEVAANIISAISTGFAPRNAIKLKDPDVFLTQIPFKHKNKNRQKVIAGRIIGKQGKIRKKIEYLCDVALLIDISKVYLIGSVKNTDLAKNAIERIINGSKHNAVINWLQETSANKEENPKKQPLL